jgi:hypothetical protein
MLLQEQPTISLATQRREEVGTRYSLLMEVPQGASLTPYSWSAQSKVGPLAGAGKFGITPQVVGF